MSALPPVTHPDIHELELRLSAVTHSIDARVNYVRSLLGQFVPLENFAENMAKENESLRREVEGKAAHITRLESRIKVLRARVEELESRPLAPDAELPEDLGDMERALVDAARAYVPRS